ncbi:MAG: hypothetical protein V1874_08115 [Spirochaetota bacterium]
MNNNRIPDIMLERYVLKELDPKKTNEIRVLSETDPDIASRIMEIRKSNEEILRTYPDDKITAEITHKYNTQNISWKKQRRIPVKYLRIIPPVAVAAAALVVFILLPAVKKDVAIIDTNDITRIKGKETALYLYKKNRNGEIDLMKNNSGAKTGDLIQIGYSTMENSYGVILSIDGRGKVTLHYPANEKQSSKLPAGKKHLLENSYELDDAPDFERFFFITSSNEINIASVVFSAEMLAVERKKAMTENLTFQSLKNESINQVSVLVKKD